ncbi:MAG: nicotinamide riboside transporter PnuC [Flavobacteriales bacterium]|nr:MAG: nicotinamide riboside transporter PnuC [Flavobacteriales bacterium]
MMDFLDQLFFQYSQYSNIDISLEIIAVFFGFLSVWFSKNNNILVFPTGMINTSIFVYLLLKWSLLGDMIINAYYFIMSIYGWYFWLKGTNNTVSPISKVSNSDIRIVVLLFISSSVFVSLVYTFFDKWETIVSYIDILTTAIFFAAMWLMAKRKVESWIFWIVGNIISVPLYLHKGLAFTSIQYFIFTIIAIAGYIKWKELYNKQIQTA